MQESDVPDKRRLPRQRTLRSARLYAEGMFQWTDCILRDVSAQGARVRLSFDWLPDKVILLDLRDGVAFTGDVAWRSKDELGVRFRCSDHVNDVPRFAPMRAVWLEHQLRACPQFVDRRTPGPSPWLLKGLAERRRNEG